jgi:hypothetical protein
MQQESFCPKHVVDDGTIVAAEGVKEEKVSDLIYLAFLV